jgi:sugar phosphate permease
LRGFYAPLHEADPKLPGKAMARGNAMSRNVAATSRVKTIQRVALAMLVLSGVVNYIDRATLAVGNEVIRHDLGLSIADMGFLLSAFLWSYAFAQLPTGAMVDKLGPRLLLSLGLSLWSLAQVLGSLVANVSQFIGARVLLGIGEAPQFPTGARVVRDWFNPRDRGLATGVFNCASTLGTAIAVPVLTVLMLAFGWRWMFAIMGIAGLAVALLWFLVYRNPTDLPLTAEENAYRTQGDPPGQRTRVTFAEWKQLFRFRSTWGMILGFFGCVYVTWIYNAWLPAYLESARHMSIRSTGYYAAIPFACGVVGGVLGGYLVDVLVRRGMTPMGSRKVPAALALFGTAVCTVAAAYVTSNTLAIVFISASLFLLYVTSTCAWALSSVAAPTNCTASIGAMQNFGGYLGGALAPTVTGLIVQATGSFQLALVVGAVIGIASGIAYLVLVRDPITAVDLAVPATPDPGVVARDARMPHKVV